MGGLAPEEVKWGNTFMAVNLVEEDWKRCWYCSKKEKLFIRVIECLDLYLYQGRNHGPFAGYAARGPKCLGFEYHDRRPAHFYMPSLVTTLHRFTKFDSMKKSSTLIKG